VTEIAPIIRHLPTDGRVEKSLVPFVAAANPATKRAGLEAA